MKSLTAKILVVFIFGVLLGVCIKFSFLAFVGLFCSLGALFIYTLKDATGLKHNQYKHFIFVSLALYAISLMLSLISAITIVLFIGYELFTNNKSVQQANKQLLPFYAIIIFVLFV
ncbi:MAG: hypothetical protein LBJ79_03740 [Endomicrobium sp.]|jgi:ABC-type Na+ efflux pump permease subunit|nr:hypothetical protein [Endomicrobium sp.]